MITKAIIRSINGAGNRCIVRIPLFETSDSASPVEAEALVNIPPGIFHNLFIGDVVFVGFEENALEKPIILGKLYKGYSYEDSTKGGMGILNKLMVRAESSQPAATANFRFVDANNKDITKTTYYYLNTAKKITDYILWLEEHTKQIVAQLDNHFRCFKSWTQWQLEAQHVEVDDGDLDLGYSHIKPCLYQAENAACAVCAESCIKLKPKETITDRKYDNAVDIWDTIGPPPSENLV